MVGNRATHRDPSRLIVWGGLEGLESHRHIQRAFHENALKLGIPSLWLKNETPSNDAIEPGDTVLTADLFGAHLAYHPAVNFVLHNFSGSHPLCEKLDKTPERFLRLQVWTDEAVGEDWGPCRRFDLNARTLFQPWGSGLLAEEFLDPVFNQDARDVIFVGAIWSDQYQGVELGNEQVIAELRAACAKHRLNFVHATQITDAEQIRLLRGARLTPALAGAWQVEKNYLPCRAFKLPAYGCAMFSNVPAVNRLFEHAAYNLRRDQTVEEQFDLMLSLSSTQYVNLVRAQQAVAAHFTYRESLQAIERAFAEMQA